MLFPLLLKANNPILISTNSFGIDQTKKLIVITKNVEEINLTYTHIKTEIIIDSQYSFENPVEMIEKGKPYTVLLADSQETYTLYFTDLPLVKIETPHEIVDSPKAWANFTLVEADGNVLTSDVGIEIRGSFSQTFPKKSFEIKFWADPEGTESVDYSLLGMRTHDGWNLQALYNEPLRTNSKTSNEIWLKLHTIYYQDLEPNAKNGISMKYVEMFINNEYRGIYAISEKVDKKQLKLKNHNGSIRGELYKGDEWGNGAVTFSWLGEYDNSSDVWDGFEYKHPKEEIDWSHLYNLIDFVMHANDENFYNNYRSLIHLDNMVDYFIFLNLTRAADNTGKNTYLAKYTSGEPYYYVPWDLDGTFGVFFDGTYNDTTDDILANNLFQRLWNDCSEGGFRNKIRERWNTVRETIFTYDSLMNDFQTNYDILTFNDAYTREKMAWPDFDNQAYYMGYLADWLENRLVFLDGVFNEECAMAGVHDQDFVTISIYPNPVQRYLTINLNSLAQGEVYVYSLNQELISKTEFNAGIKQLDLSHLKPGVYIVQVKSGKQFKTQKIIVQP